MKKITVKQEKVIDAVLQIIGDWKTGVQSRNINSVCHKKRKHAGGFRWFFESDNEWLDLIK